ncbi:ribonuclease P protein subunit p40-like [Leguminivora glycinivorella]|uniref:ribonuclease P protein subunit p40-like n=1 Tax=Leguminivora glycinivorella TaxID=1035111 RepID=UPI00200EC8D8|nr:ribonuclease P protein subunit p40-like [Leguminivora glycinivorella]
MLCPEIYNFPYPKIISSSKRHENFEAAFSTIRLNTFYKSLIVTCPDEMHTPNSIEEAITEDTEYYKVSKCSLTLFTKVDFIENFVKKGSLNCMSVVRNCVVENCAAITPDGTLTLHVLDFIYQQLGLEGKKRPHNFYEVKIDLGKLKHDTKIASSLSKLETFDFFVSWEPYSEDICPSSIAKYFYDNDINIAVCPVKIDHVSPSVEEIPALDAELYEMSEWIGMLAHKADTNPTETYISSYSSPESENAMKSSRIALVIAKGFFSPATVERLCRKVEEYVKGRETEQYWASVSVQSFENCLWQWSRGSPRMFQAHDSSCNLFFSHTGVAEYSVGQIKYS